MKGVKFILQKKTSASPETWTDITQNDSNNTDYNLTTDKDGKITIAGLSQGDYRIFEDAYSVILLTRAISWMRNTTTYRAE